MARIGQTAVDGLVASVGDDVARVGARALRATEVTAAHDADAWDRLRQEWRSMPVDAHLPNGATYRQRRYARLEAIPTDDGWALQTLAHVAFRQPEEIVPLYGGQARMFPPIAESVTSSRTLQHLLRFDLDVVSRVVGQREPYVLGLHMIRVTATSATSATRAMGVSPAPPRGSPPRRPPIRRDASDRP